MPLKLGSKLIISTTSNQQCISQNINQKIIANITYAYYRSKLSKDRGHALSHCNIQTLLILSMPHAGE